MQYCKNAKTTHDDVQLKIDQIMSFIYCGSWETQTKTINFDESVNIKQRRKENDQNRAVVCW